MQLTPSRSAWSRCASQSEIRVLPPSVIGCARRLAAGAPPPSRCSSSHAGRSATWPGRGPRIARGGGDEVGVRRLELTTAPENVASQRVAERAGFTREGVLRGLVATKDNRREDSVMFSLLSADLG